MALDIVFMYYGLSPLVECDVLEKSKAEVDLLSYKLWFPGATCYSALMCNARVGSYGILHCYMVLTSLT